MSPSGSSSQPGGGPDTHCPPIRPCSKWGLTVAASPPPTGRSYRPISPLPPVPRPVRTEPSSVPSQLTGGGMFLCHFPSPALLRKPGSYPAPCPAEPGLSSLPKSPETRLFETAVTQPNQLPPFHSSIGFGKGQRKINGRRQSARGQKCGQSPEASGPNQAQKRSQVTNAA